MTSTRGESYLWRGSYEQKQRGEEERIFDCPLFLHWMISFRVYYTRCVAVRVLARSLSHVFRVQRYANYGNRATVASLLITRQEEILIVPVECSFNASTIK